MIRKNGEWVFGSLKPVSPLLEGQLNSYEFPVANVIVTFRRAEFSVEEGAWMESRWIPLLLGKDGSHTRSGSIYFNNEGSFWIRVNEDGSMCERRL